MLIVRVKIWVSSPHGCEEENLGNIASIPQWMQVVPCNQGQFIVSSFGLKYQDDNRGECSRKVSGYLVTK